MLGVNQPPPQIFLCVHAWWRLLWILFLQLEPIHSHTLFSPPSLFFPFVSNISHSECFEGSFCRFISNVSQPYEAMLRKNVFISFFFYCSVNFLRVRFFFFFLCSRWKLFLAFSIVWVSSFSIKWKWKIK